jgi:hypothetical protein
MADDNAVRQRRARQHKAGDHTLCNPERCPHASPSVIIDADPTDEPGKTGTDGKRTTHRYQGKDRDLLEDVVAAGDHRKSLEALRDYLARRLDEPWTHGRDAAPLAQRLTDVIEKLAALPDPAGVSQIDDLERARRERRARPRKAAG